MKKTLARREFIKLSAMGTAALGLGIKIPSVAFAAGTPSFRALICIEQLGGCDNFLFSIPVDTARKNALISRRGQYATAYYSDPHLLQVGYGSNMALHPGLYPLQSYLNKMRVTLGIQNAMHIAPSGSHEVQQIRMSLGTNLSPNVNAGWMSRIYDASPTARLIGFSGSRSQDFQCESTRCQQHPPLVTDVLETYRIDGVSFGYARQGGSQNAVQVANAVRALSQVTPSNSSELETRFRNGQSAMFESIQDVQNTLTNFRSPQYDNYLSLGGPDSYTAQRFRNIAQILYRMKMENSSDRVIFSVPHGSYDIHQNWASNANYLMGSIGSVLKVFADDCVAMGIFDQVVVQTMTEFGRQIGTNGPDSGSGTDHGQGFSALTLGGRVNGGANLKWGDFITPQQISNLYDWPSVVDSRSIISDIVQYHLQLDPYTTAFPGVIGQEFLRPNLSLFI